MRSAQPKYPGRKKFHGKLFFFFSLGSCCPFTPEGESNLTPLLDTLDTLKNPRIKRSSFWNDVFSGPQFAKMKNLKKQNELDKFKLKSWHILSWESQGTTNKALFFGGDGLGGGGPLRFP